MNLTPDSGQIKRSVIRRLASGKTRAWPGRDDYGHWLAEQGYLANESDFSDAIEFHARVTTDWVRRGQTSCMFASLLAAKNEIAGWDSVVFTGSEFDSSVGDRANDVLYAVEEHTEVVQLIFPHVTEAGQLVELINSLCANSSWYWEPVSPADETCTLVGLRWRLSTNVHVSWTVGFGPFMFLPFTRRAPFTTIQVRVSSTKRTPPNPDGHGYIPVHLADMDDLLASSAVRQALFEKTKQAKQEYLAGEYLHAARARVTFRVPAESAEALCHPR